MHILRGIRMVVVRMMMVRLVTRATCHCEMCATCFPEGGVPTLPPFLTCLFCPKNGRVKEITGFLKLEEVYRLTGPRGEWGCGSQKRPL